MRHSEDALHELTMDVGMGQSICCLLAKEGCSRIFLADISEESLGKTRDLLRDIRAQTEVVTHVVDVSKETAVVGMVEACVKEFGRLDCAVNCAGLARGSIKTVDTPLDVFEKLCSVNEKGVRIEIPREFTAASNTGPRSSFARSMRSDRC